MFREDAAKKNFTLASEGLNRIEIVIVIRAIDYRDYRNYNLRQEIEMNRG